MDLNGIVNGLNKIGCILSVELKDDDSYGAICVEAANETYLKSVNVAVEDFVPGKPYSEYVPPTRNYEQMCFRCVKENRMVHSYINLAQYNAWMEVYLLPLKPAEEGKKGLLLFSYEMTPMLESEKLSDLSPDLAVKVINTAVKLRETDDFAKAMDSIIRDVRISCEANRSCILLTDLKSRICSVLCESVAEFESDIPNVSSYLDEDFIRIVETWDGLIAGSNCYIIHDEKEMELLKDKSRIWYDFLKLAGVYNLVLYPLKANGETIGYMWATNFNSNNTLNIKAILEITSFMLAAEIANHQLFEKTKILSNTDLLTGLYNRNAMNNRISDIVAGDEKIHGDYGVVFADMNGLKTVNDKKGHKAGDELLKAAARLLKLTYRDAEIFRVGGDEFLVIVTGKDEAGFKALADELREKAESSGTVSFAIGTCFGSEDLDIRKAMFVADGRMYKDKDEYYDRHPELQRRVVTK
ncbi:MAG: GGDEF domain-containing protein [Lachnospiraceae bacterium]|nr:GGDEF domain-containing protein [Lachnospiraceae bacterium]